MAVLGVFKGVLHVADIVGLDCHGSIFGEVYTVYVKTGCIDGCRMWKSCIRVVIVEVSHLAPPFFLQDAPSS